MNYSNSVRFLPSPATRLPAWFAGMLRDLTAAWRASRTMRELDALSDDQLRDVGLNRDDIGRIARGLAPLGCPPPARRR